VAAGEEAEMSIKTQIEFVDDVETGQWYHALTAGVVFKAVSKDLTFDSEKGVYEGTVGVEYAAADGSEETLTAEGIRSFGLPDEVVPVPERVVTEPEEVLLDLGEERANDYHETLGLSHPYNGIDGVQTVGDLVAAMRVRENRQQVLVTDANPATVD
jgi:hypothetical protein